MALQDLSPQLRTRLSRVERLVGVFVTLAALLMIAGFAYYIHHTAQRKGWFLAKVPYVTGVNNAEGLKAGATVKLMGMEVGTITGVEPNDPSDYYGVTVYFEVRSPHHGYIWSDSQVRVVSGLLSDRSLEITKGSESWAIPTVVGTNRTSYRTLDHNRFQRAVSDMTNTLFAAELAKTGASQIDPDRAEVLQLQTRYNIQALAAEKQDEFYVHWEDAPRYWLVPVESRPVGERLEEIADTVEKALPSFLTLTNQLTAILNNAAQITTKIDGMLEDARPAVRNLTQASEDLPRLASHAAMIAQNLTNSQGSLGEWLITPDLNTQLDRTFDGVNVVLGSANTNLVSLNESLENLSKITADLAAQVRANSNMLSGVSQLVLETDSFVQGLRRHWFLRSAFKERK